MTTHMSLENRVHLWRGIEARGGIADPGLGVPLDVHRYAYRERRSAEFQAAVWNEIVAGHPVYDPAFSGFKVGAAAASENGYFPLIWVRA